MGGNQGGARGRGQPGCYFGVRARGARGRPPQWRGGNSAGGPLTTVDSETLRNLKEKTPATVFGKDRLHNRSFSTSFKMYVFDFLFPFLLISQ